MVIQANFGDAAPKKAKEWSPIDRMLAEKRNSRRQSPKPQSADPLPPIPQLPPRPPATKSSSEVEVQTAVSWDALQKDAVAAERQRVTSLQAELKGLKAKLAASEEAARAAEARADEEASKRLSCEQALAAVQAELAAVLQAQGKDGAALDEHRRCQEAQQKRWDEEKQRWEEERKRWEEERARWQDERKALQGSVADLREDADSLREALERSRKECAALKRRCQDLDAEHIAVRAERDGLMHRLEKEQADMIARVEQIQRKMDEKDSARSKRPQVDLSSCLSSAYPSAPAPVCDSPQPPRRYSNLERPNLLR
eukprot:gnl/TRDRNA2_/TRDRNA2_193405_c0_seq1.p1 gnl/TRDRNA2_/TRDRNA2_193405_c0~~gnl/TRDRNA2_/TRDRNA2_193405_c0_seq1.p1  ORF type:complete len:313 (+),score=80.97 gnl/TRDRNA2_/TRDRNA2_193405_c0_seq1:73-1011(+)